MKKIMICLLVMSLSFALLSSCGNSESKEEASKAPAAESNEKESSVNEEKEQTQAEEESKNEAEDAAKSAESQENAESSSEEAPEQTEESYGPLCFMVGDFAFGILDSVDDVMAVLGDPVDTFTAASCAYQGDDYFYYYDGFEFTGNIIDEVNRIISITIDDDTVSLPQGVKIGMDITEAVDLVNESMGGNAEDLKYTASGSNYAFVSGPCTLLIQAGSDDCVKAIQFVRTME